MFRSGLLLSVSAPAALLTLLIQPTVQQAADQRAPRAAPSTVIQVTLSGPDLPGQRVASTAISPVRFASVSRPSSPPKSGVLGQSGRTASEKDQPKVRRSMREGCEGAISSLAGPEARRMLPGRCIS